jgi:hypothetical protein
VLLNASRHPPTRTNDTWCIPPPTRVSRYPPTSTKAPKQCSTRPAIHHVPTTHLVTNPHLQTTPSASHCPPTPANAPRLPTTPSHVPSLVHTSKRHASRRLSPTRRPSYLTGKYEDVAYFILHFSYYKHSTALLTSAAAEKRRWCSQQAPITQLTASHETQQRTGGRSCPTKSNSPYGASNRTLRNPKTMNDDGK